METLDDKKAEDILLLDIHASFPFADYFVICTGTSDRMLNALAKAVDEKIHEVCGLNARFEGGPQDGWMLVDFGDVIVHIFSEEQREYYQLEDVWNDSKAILRVK